ncbi:MAG: histidine phosphatase family protein [Bryobacteraceae bacterium]
MAGPRAIVLLRHAEPQSSGNDPALTAEGTKRARLLASMLRDAGVMAIFTSELRRTQKTAQPLADLVRVAPEVLVGLDSTAHRDRVLAVRRGVAVVIGHTNTVPPLIAALGVRTPVTISPLEFDRLFLVTRNSGGATLLSLRYGG